MAVVVIFGLVVATFLTLVVVPTLYYLIEHLGGKWQQLKSWAHRMYWKPYTWLVGEKDS